MQLVVFELRVQGSVGATRRDLHEAIELVARGVVRTVVDRTLPLADWERGLRALADGELVGKAVLVP
jgi:propanol-preferring alcohol dehydrogenase